MELTQTFKASLGRFAVIEEHTVQELWDYVYRYGNKIWVDKYNNGQNRRIRVELYYTNGETWLDFYNIKVKICNGVIGNNPEQNPDSNPVQKPDSKPDSNPVQKPDSKPDSNSDSNSDSTWEPNPNDHTTKPTKLPYDDQPFVMSGGGSSVSHNMNNMGITKGKCRKCKKMIYLKFGNPTKKHSC